MEQAGSIIPALTTRHRMHRLANGLAQGHQLMLYQEKSRDLPTPSTVLFRGSRICCTTNIQLLMRFFPLNIKRNILYKSKHKALLWERKTRHGFGGGYTSIRYSALLMWWQKNKIQVQDMTPLPSAMWPSASELTFSLYLFISQMGIISAPPNAQGFVWSNKSIYSIVLETRCYLVLL